MATNFPSGSDTFPAAATLVTHQLGTDPHSTLHGNLGDAVTAVETWLLPAGNVTLGLNGAITSQLDRIGGLTQNL